MKINSLCLHVALSLPAFSETEAPERDVKINLRHRSQSMKSMNFLPVVTLWLVSLGSPPALTADTELLLHGLQLSEGAPEPGFMVNVLAGRLPDGNVSLDPAFEPGVTAYVASVSERLLTIRGRAAAGVKMNVTGTSATGNALSIVNQFSIGNANNHGSFISVTLSGLDAGENVVALAITGKNGSETRRYQVRVTAVAQDTGLSTKPSTKAARQVPDRDDLDDAAAQDLLLSSTRDENAVDLMRAIEAGADVNAPGEKALLLAVDKENAEIVRILVDAGADVNYSLPKHGEFEFDRSINGITALLLAVASENAEIVQLLIAAGADVNYVLPWQEFMSRATSGMSALLMAAEKEHEEIARLLIAAGADVDYALPEQHSRSGSTRGMTALLLAAQAGYKEIVRLLIDAGADLNQTLPDDNFPAQTSSGGASALIFAVNRGHAEIVRLLIEGGVDVNYRIPGKRPHGLNPNTAGLTALRVARAREDKGLVRLLRKAGAKR